jgi:plasmid maintenance system antidote protein VapI
MKKITHIKMAKTLGVSPAYVCQILTGKVSVSWKMADKLSELFPGKTLKQWKAAGPDDIRRAFSMFEGEA